MPQYPQPTRVRHEHLLLPEWLPFYAILAQGPGRSSNPACGLRNGLSALSTTQRYPDYAGPHTAGIHYSVTYHPIMLEDVYQPDSDPMLDLVWDSSVPPRSSPVEKLYIGNSYIDSKPLACLIRSIQALQGFCFDFDDAVRNESYTLYETDVPELHYPALATALLEHKDTLEELGINDNSDPHLNEMYEIDPESLGSLHELYKVRVLDVDLECFGGVDVDFNQGADVEHLFTTVVRPADLAQNLPAALEQLTLTINEECDTPYERFWINSLEDLAKTVRTSLPALKRINVQRRDGCGIRPENETDVERLVQMFADADVQFLIPEEWGGEADEDAYATDE
jgi:hypothetical protein